MPSRLSWRRHGPRPCAAPAAGASASPQGAPSACSRSRSASAQRAPGAHAEAPGRAPVERGHRAEGRACVADVASVLLHGLGRLAQREVFSLAQGPSVRLQRRRRGRRRGSNERANGRSASRRRDRRSVRTPWREQRARVAGWPFCFSRTAVPRAGWDGGARLARAQGADDLVVERRLARRHWAQIRALTSSPT